MSIISDIIRSILSAIGRDAAPLATIIAVLIMIFVMSLFEFIVYRTVSHRQIYNKHFHVALMVIPFFIGVIVMALQSNVVITLGTIGALAIIRFRTAIKDSTDMVYLLWSIFIGITCGCQFYESCILTSVIVTLILLFVNTFGGKLFKNPYLLVINCDEDKESQLSEIIKKYSSSFRLKSRNFSANGVDYVYELSLKDASGLSKDIQESGLVKRYSLLEYDGNDII